MELALDQDDMSNVHHATIAERGHGEDIPMGLAADQDDMASVQEFQQWAIFRRLGRRSAGLLPPWSSQRPSSSVFEQQDRRSIKHPIQVFDLLFGVSVVGYTVRSGGNIYRWGRSL
jgi:hypothetical protein